MRGADFESKEQALSRARQLVREGCFSDAERILRPLTEDGPAADDERVLSLCAQACLHRILDQGGVLGEVEELLRRAMRLPKLSPASYSSGLNRLGIVAYYQERYDDAIAIYREALSELPTSGETRQLRNRLGGNLAEALRSSDDPEAANAEYLKVMEQLDESDDLYTQGALYLGLALNDHDRRRDDVAVQRALRAQALFNRLSDPILSSRAGLHLGYFLISKHLLEPATESLYNSLKAAEHDGGIRLKFLSRYHLALLGFQRQDYSEAERLAQAAYQAAKQGGFRRYMADSATLLAELAWLTGDYQTAVSRWFEAGHMCERLGLAQRAGQIWQRIGMLLSERGDLEGSRRLIERALRCLHSTPLPTASPRVGS